MAADSALIEILKESFAPLGRIAVKRMFGGAGVYCDGIFFAIIDGAALYLKTSEADRDLFRAEGLGPFTYTTKDGTSTLGSYFRAPERLLDEPDEMQAWGARAIRAARLSQSEKASRKSKATAQKRSGRKAAPKPRAR